MAFLGKGKHCIVLCSPHVVGWGQWNWNVGREPDGGGHACPPEGDENGCADNKKRTEGGLCRRDWCDQIYAWERRPEHSEHRVTIVGETGSGKATRQSWEAVQEPPWSVCLGRIRGVPWAVLPGGLRRAVERGLCVSLSSPLAQLPAPTSEMEKG